MSLLETLKGYEEQGLVTLREHPDHSGLHVANYTPRCAYDKLWDTVTLAARGMMVDETGVVARCLPKFFNFSEHDGSTSYLPALQDTTVTEVHEKYDGSLITVINHPRYENLLVASRGSFTSDHAAWAEEIIEENRGFERDFPEGHTYIFELIHPDNRIVVDYHGDRTLILLAEFDPEGNEAVRPLHPSYPGAKKFRKQPVEHQQWDKLHPDFDLHEHIPNHEGWVALHQFPDGHVVRVKYKHEEYVALHRVVANLTDKNVFEAVREERIDQILDVLPDEHWDWVRELRRKIDNEVENLRLAVKKTPIPDGTRKEQAQWILEHHRDISSLLFVHLDGKLTDETIFKHLAKQKGY